MDSSRALLMLACCDAVDDAWGNKNKRRAYWYCRHHKQNHQRLQKRTETNNDHFLRLYMNASFRYDNRKRETRVRVLLLLSKINQAIKSSSPSSPQSTSHAVSVCSHQKVAYVTDSFERFDSNFTRISIFRVP